MFLLLLFGVQDLLVEVFTAEMPNAPEASEVQATLATQAQAINVKLDDPQLKVRHYCTAGN